MTQIITTTLNPEGYIAIGFNGDITHDTVDGFKEELMQAGEVIKKHFEETHTKVRILLDVSHFSGNYASEALEALVNFARANELIVEKTASFGGSDSVHMAGEAAIALSGRHNIKIFKGKVDAIMWLMS